MSWSRLERKVAEIAAACGMILFGKDSWGKDNGESVVARNFACYYPDPNSSSGEESRNNFFNALSELKGNCKLSQPKNDQNLDEAVLFLGRYLCREVNNHYEIACARDEETACEAMSEWKT